MGKMETGLKKLFIYLFVAALGLHCCPQAFLSCGERGDSVAVVQWASHRGGFSFCGAWALGAGASVVVANRLSCPTACGIFPDQGLNRCPLHCKANSQPLDPQGGPRMAF